MKNGVKSRDESSRFVKMRSESFRIVLSRENPVQTGQTNYQNVLLPGFRTCGAGPTKRLKGLSEYIRQVYLFSDGYRKQPSAEAPCRIVPNGYESCGMIPSRKKPGKPEKASLPDAVRNTLTENSSHIIRPAEFRRLQSGLPRLRGGHASPRTRN